MGGRRVPISTNRSPKLYSQYLNIYGGGLDVQQYIPYCTGQGDCLEAASVLGIDANEARIAAMQSAGLSPASTFT